MNTTALAWLGDAVYEVAVRKFIMEKGPRTSGSLHHMAIKFVCAEGQAMVIKKLMQELTEEEQALVRRARNRRITSKPNHADPVTYKLSTAFEAFVGYLYLIGNQERLDWFIDQAIAIIDKEDRYGKEEKAGS